MDWPIQQIAALAGTTSRTLRHYDSIGLLPPSRIASNGYRHYDADALHRLQRILLLRELGLGLPAISAVLDRPLDTADALGTHVEWLKQERRRLDRQIASVERTIDTITTGGTLMPEDMLDGFDHTEHREEVERRWGREAYASGDAWWSGLDAAAKQDWKDRVAALSADWSGAAARGIDPASAEAQELARRHVEWLSSVPGTPASRPGGDMRGYVTGLGQMYVDDPRFGANYGGPTGAAFVRDALAVYADREL
ncbi:MerR family transcriptional regulator [Arthrobacter sp. JSM 101049]|uniref:MerR family transcriptional regulator n=1 Tax=Arthrobacter sp. JSM 101049 TaxID=929097 RepID=UPI0035654D4B